MAQRNKLTDPRSAAYDITESYKHLLPQIARLKNTSPSNIEIIDHCCGEDTIFVNGQWRGYVDDELFAELDLMSEYDKKERTESLQDYILRKLYL